MSITPCAIDPRRAAPKPSGQIDPAEKLRKRVYTAFSATVGIVLVIAVCYVAARVFTERGNAARSVVMAKVSPKAVPPVRAVPPIKAQAAPPIKTQALATQPPVAPVAVKQASAPAKVQAQPIPAPVPEKPVSTQAPGQTWTTVTPHTGETYLQVIALGGQFVERYVNGLKAKGLHPLVAVSPLDGVYRVLFGPFKDRPARDAESKDLEAAGLQAMVQVY
jgi:hypothetical protein